jgi:hypothetical protein
MSAPKRGIGKNKQFLLNRLQDMYGDDFHPIMKMAQNCKTLQDIADEHAQGLVSVDSETGAMIDASTTAIAANQAWKEIAPYTEPKLTAKTVEVSGEDGGPLQIQEVRRSIVEPDVGDTDS